MHDHTSAADTTTHTSHDTWTDSTSHYTDHVQHNHHYSEHVNPTHQPSHNANNGRHHHHGPEAGSPVTDPATNLVYNDHMTNATFPPPPYTSRYNRRLDQRRPVTEWERSMSKFAPAIFILVVILLVVCYLCYDYC
ncbi:hypothetical protein EJ08DRAFT_647013, partial [Tothia fuscella]